MVVHPPASEASRVVANLIERKNQHTPVYGAKEFACLSVSNFDPNYLRTGRTEWDEIFSEHLCQKAMFQKNCFTREGACRARAEGQIKLHDMIYFIGAPGCNI